MGLSTWSKYNVEYGRKLFHSGLDGARCGEQAFLHEKPVATFVSESVCNALTPAAIGACLGILGSRRSHQRSVKRTVAFAFLGGVIGFAAGVGWQGRRLTASVASGALKNIGRTRDEHWLEKHPIDYA